MKKILLSAAAAGALAFGGAASAQDLGRILSDVLSNIGQPAYNYGHPNPPPITEGAPGRVFSEGGRWYYEDAYGRRLIPGDVVYDGAGNPMYKDAWGNWVNVASGSPYDRDGDGVADANDRWPNDRRYW